MTPPAGILKPQPNVLISEWENCKAGFEQWVLLMSDVHFDNRYCNRKLLKKHLDQAVDRGAVIIDTGDLHCAMQGKWDKRADPTQLKPEYREGHYLDNLVKYAAEFYAPYAKNILQISPGNHETSIVKRHETNLTERTAERIHALTGHKIHVGTYSGWIRFRFRHGRRLWAVALLHYHHGYGGGGPVTKGVIDTARMGLYLPDADIVTCGHVHYGYEMPIQRLRINACGRTFTDTQTHVRTPGYKDEVSHGEGWAVERGHPPKPQGAVWIRFHMDKGDVDANRISWEITRAK